MKSQIKAAAILTGAMLLPFGALTAFAATPTMRGDVNLDEKLSVSDVVLLSRYVNEAEGVTLNKTALANADMDGDGEPTSADVTKILRIIARLEEPEPIITVPEHDPAYIHLNGNSITYEGEYVSVSGNTATISASGEYYLDGNLNGGQIIVNVPDETADPETVKLFLNGVSITNRNAPAILIENAENTSINLVEGKENTLSDGDEAPSAEQADHAVLHAKDDMTIKGEGSLTIQAGTQYGIHCGNDLKFNGGTVSITTLLDDAVRGKTSVTIKDGTLLIDTEGDGIKSTQGSIEMENGSVSIKSGKDAMQAETTMTLTGGMVLACGDRGLTAAQSVEITDASVIATATDNVCETLSDSCSNAVQLSFTKQWSKNNPLSLLGSDGSVKLEQNTRKKYRYAIISDAALSDQCSIYAGGIEVQANGSGSFKGGKSYTDVNNTDHAKLLYSNLFDKSKVHKIEVEMSNWSEFMTHADQEVYYPCDIVIDGERFTNAAIRTKGNSSRMFVSQANGKKFSWRIKLDKYDKFQNYHGLTEFCMNNMYSDPSCMRDVLCYDALHEIDGVGPNCAYTDMYLNGSLYSFYFLAEQPGTTLAERLATTDDAVLYKATDNAGGGGGGWGFGFGGNDGYCSFTDNMPLNNFDVKFGTDDEFAHIDAVKQAISRVSSTNYKFIEDVIDVPSFLKGFAVNSVMCNYDSYNGTLAHNYYLMYNDGKCYFVGWDYNLSLGNFTGGADAVNSDVKTSLYQVEVKDRPLAKLLQVDEYYKMYIGYVKQILALYSDPQSSVDHYAALIRDHVKADPNSFFTYDQFTANTSKSAQGLQTGGNGGNGGWGGFGGFGGFGGGGGFNFGGDQISVVDFLIKRNEVIRQAIGY